MTEIQLGLLPDELMHIVLARFLIEGPGGTAEMAEPVVGRASVGSRIAPDVPIRLRVIAAAPAFEKPGMLVRGVIGNEVEQKLHTASMCLRQEKVEVIHGDKYRMYAAVVEDIIAKIMHGGWKNGGKPDGIDIERIGQIVQALDHTVQVTDPVAVAIHETARIDLIDHPRVPPQIILFAN